MIQELCNIGNEHHIDTFYKIAVMEATQFQKFNHLTTDAAVNTIISEIPDNYQILITDLLPKDIKVSSPTKITDAGVLYSSDISFTLTPQDKYLQQLLETYNNKEVIVLVSKRKTNHLYGSVAQPLLFKYAPLNANDPSSIKGYTIDIEGETYGPERLFENVSFNIYTRGLAFQLAQEL